MITRDVSVRAWEPRCVGRGVRGHSSIFQGCVDPVGVDLAKRWALGRDRMKEQTDLPQSRIR